MSDDPPLFTSLSVDPGLLVIMDTAELEATFGACLSPSEDDRRICLTDEYAMKRLIPHEAETRNEVHVAQELNRLAGMTQTFAYCYGYLLLAPPPPSSIELLLVYERISHRFSELPDVPQVNEDYYFELLIGLYHARKTFHFVHWDVHRGNLMWQLLPQAETRVHRVEQQPGGVEPPRSGGSTPLFIVIKDSTVLPKLVDYGRSAVMPDYEDAQWREEPRYRKMWAKSDLYHLSLIMSQRDHLSERLRAFLEQKVLPVYRSSMYATRLEADSGANYGNIARLLQTYYGEQKLQCLVCRAAEARYTDERKGLYCGEVCQIRAAAGQ